MKIKLDSAIRNHPDNIESIDWMIFVYGPIYKRKTFSFAYQWLFKDLNYFMNHIDKHSKIFTTNL